jgi:hypothetical protein
MNSKTIKFLLALFLGFAFFLGSAYAEGDVGQKSNTLNKPGSPIRAYMNINFISTVIKNTGISDIDPVETNSGLVYPKGSGKTAVFQSGLVWGAIVDDPDVPNVGGSTYREGLQGGQINSDGTFPDPNSAGVRIFRVRPDAAPGTTTEDVNVTAEAQDEAKSESDILTQYQLDWNEWPANLGAPYTDVDENGSYDPTVDIPGVPGADQTIWFVANDQEPGLTQNLYGTLPMGIEMQATFWAYAQTGALGNMFFRRYLLTNKTDVLGDAKTFEDMYVCMWSDPDVGNSTDDFAGSDTLLSLVYAYNGIANDPTYSPLPPPAVGFDFFQGPIVESAGDSAIFQGEYIQGFKNLPMTAAFYFTRGDATVTDPVLGSPTEGAVRMYRFMQGRVGLTDLPFIDPTTGQPTKFALNGDPITKTGWIDGLLQAPGDRRIGAASGPFDMAPGDVQEIVVAEICGGAIPGVDRISAVALMKFYDQVAQVAYDNFFDLPTPPPSPSVTTAVLDGEIVLDWSKDNNRVLATESSNIKGYTFQGYNVYQLPSASAGLTEAVRLATYDLADGVGKINDLVFDPSTGSVVTLPVQFGNDTGIKRYLSITQDAINSRPLINGVRYYFAVTAYNYNPDPLAVPNNLENPLQILTLIPQSNNPGVTYGEGVGEEVQITHDGTADGGPIVTIVDPTATTGHEYEVFFTERAEIRDENGDWVPSSTVLRKYGSDGPNGLDTLTGSSIDISSVFSPQAGVVELMCYFNYVSSDGNWADGIEMDFPPGMDIVDFPTFEAGGGTIDPVITGDPSTGLHVEMGDVTGILSEDGIFHGGEEWSIFVTAFTPPQNVDWEIWDDGWSGGAVNAVGTTVLEEIGFASRLAKYWNLRDVTAGTVKLEEQSLISGVDIFPDRDDIPTDLGVDSSPIVDGFQINLAVGYDAPLTISANNPPLLNGEEAFSFSGSDVWWTSDNFIICDFTRFGYADGTAATSLPLYGGAGGTSDVNILQQDYEFRWTGVVTDTVINGNTLFYTPSGGSIITLFGASGYDLIDHPLNTSGVEQSIAVRVPFEVWNLDNDEQVNVVFWDRSGDPTADSGSVWNQLNREYIWIVNTPYSEDVIDVTSQSVADNATWVWGPYLSTLTIGDVVRINYDNPIQIGTDTYSFTTTAPGYSSSLAKDQVDEINVFPNPYYGINTEELNKYNRFVTFTHMPEQAKVRIFNLAGVLVRTLDKEDPGQFVRWDLANEDGFPVASGLYIAYIELPELGTTKILKLAIIQEQQVLDRF